MLENLYLRKLTFRLKAEEPLLLPPYKGAIFRGAFGLAFRDTVCITKQPFCNNCMMRKQCIYFKYFESELPVSDIPFLRGIKKTPHPFVIHPPLSSATIFPKGYEFEFEITLFGSATENVAYFIYAIKRMCNEGIGAERGECSLIKVDDTTPSVPIQTIYSEEGGYGDIENRIFRPIDHLEINGTETKTIKLVFKTPVRLQELGKPITEPSRLTAKLLTVGIVRRCMVVSYLFCEALITEEPLFDFDKIEVSQNSLSYFDWSRFSTRQKKRMNLGGFTGSLSLNGEILSVIPWFYAGSFINAGKNTLFGLGRYDLVIEKPKGSDS